jgi:hypothetical protein
MKSGEEHLLTIDIKSGRLEMRSTLGGAKAVYKIRKLKGGEIDLEPQEGVPPPLVGTTLEGIYSLDGDTLKICYTAVPLDDSDPPLKRPTEFKAPKDSKYMLRILQRKK